MATKVRVALAQMAPKMGDVEGNFSRILSCLTRAKKAKADIVIYPELATVGYLSQGIFLEVAEKEENLLKKLADETKHIYAVLGMVEESRFGILHNSAIVIGEGKIVEGYAGSIRQRAYRKCYLPTYGMFEERRWFAPGHRVPVFTLNIRNAGPVKLGIVICEDYWHPLPIRTAVTRGAELIAVISSSPKTLQKPGNVDALLKARAIENSTYVVFVNAAGSQDMVNFWGGSKIISPDGGTVKEAKMREEDFIVGEIDLYRQRKLRQVNPMIRDERAELIRDYLNAYEEAAKD